ncbi:MAG: hypothetical protein IAF00_12055 [Phycisphaerales bacterium]|nr:hypothetical protein [Phycisphaerales bacterium]
MNVLRQIHTVCPHCKRPVVAIHEQPHAHCAEHGSIVPMRSAVANAPLQTRLIPAGIPAGIPTGVPVEIRP